MVLGRTPTIEPHLLGEFRLADRLPPSLVMRRTERRATFSEKRKFHDTFPFWIYSQYSSIAGHDDAKDSPAAPENRDIHISETPPEKQ
jgi:hypothetical protein